ncbi:MAG: UDP-N-acetylmuramate--L-alanine ligase [Alphaproteobacteria bacterium]|nr:UDP-N-acetylmuramate--L-alanine ligase [Alphaproteobacteria bacterium]
MKALPLDIGVIHFVGIGGIGMSGIAEIMRNLGYKVQGSDSAENANVQRLRRNGIRVMLGHLPENLGDAQVVVYSSAIKPDNPEIVAARRRHVPVVRRAEMLAELMRLKWSVAVGGTHGKTTTTSLCAAVLEGAGFDPTVINGGIINAYGTNARLGAGDWMVVEADESDGSFTRLPATIAIVTNIDPEHLDHYKTFDAERVAFQAFVQNIPFYGFAVLCLDHPEVQALMGRISDRRIVAYGLSPQADVRALNIRNSPRGTVFDVSIADKGPMRGREIAGVELPMHGLHNVQNALAAIAVAHEMHVDPEAIKRALAGFTGVKRRFTRTGAAGGITVIDDYGHHPVEIAAVLRAARAAFSGKVIAVVQPHRYSRLHDLFDEFCTCFNDADAVIVAEVYPAGEQPIPGIDRDALVAGLQRHGHKHVVPLDDPARLAAESLELAGPGDVVVCLGAGNITNWAYALPGQIATLKGEAVQGGAQ